MRMILFLAGLAATTARAEEPPASPMRQKLHEKVMERAPPPPPAEPAQTPKEDEPLAGPVLVMRPVVVSESIRSRDFEAAKAREKQKLEEERFSIVTGGTLFRKDIGGRRIEVGGWWDPREGWRFLKLSW